MNPLEAQLLSEIMTGLKHSQAVVRLTRLRACLVLQERGRVHYGEPLRQWQQALRRAVRVWRRARLQQKRNPS